VLRNRWPMSCVNPTVLPKVPLERWQPYPMNRGPNRWSTVAGKDWPSRI